jgi:hypothetical protein
MYRTILSSAMKDKNIVNTSQRNNMFIQNPVRLVFIIGLFHIIVAVALSLYLLYVYITYGHFPIWVFAVMMIWIVGAFVIISLGYIGKKIIKQIL